MIVQSPSITPVESYSASVSRSQTLAVVLCVFHISGCVASYVFFPIGIVNVAFTLINTILFVTCGRKDYFWVVTYDITMVAITFSVFSMNTAELRGIMFYGLYTPQSEIVNSTSIDTSADFLVRTQSSISTWTLIFVLCLIALLHLTSMAQFILGIMMLYSNSILRQQLAQRDQIYARGTSNLLWESVRFSIYRPPAYDATVGEKVEKNI